MIFECDCKLFNNSEIALFFLIFIIALTSISFFLIYSRVYDEFASVYVQTGKLHTIYSHSIKKPVNKNICWFQNHTNK